MRKLIIAVLAAAVLFACTGGKEQNGGGGGGTGAKATVVRVSTSSMTFEALGAEPQTVKVFADGSWTSEAPEWVTLNPASGDGTVTVTVSVTDNEGKEGRTGTIVFGPELTGSTTNKVTVQQKFDSKVTIKTPADFAEWLAGLTAESLDEAVIAADLDMSGITLEPAKGFSGSLNGGNHLIKNLVSTQPLFKKNSGTLSNIVIDESCSFTPDSLVFGALVTRNEGVVKDCVNKASVTRSIGSTDKESNIVAGLIAVSTPKDDGAAPISGCKNYGKISLIVDDSDAANGEFTTQGVAGVVGYSLTPLSGCENYGEVSLSGGWHGRRACPVRDPQDVANIEKGEFYNQKVASSLGGVVAWAIGTLENCKNEGKVSWTESKVENMNTSPARMFTGGVAGTYYGAVKDCSNAGAVVVRVVTSTGADFNGQNHQHCIGGVLGAVNNPSADSPSKNRGVSVSGCTNSGPVTVEANTSKSPAHVGGVAGWPASDNDNTTPSNWGVMSGCSNSGVITIGGTANLRVGGVVGAAPYMENCSNTGKIIINGTKDHSEVGGVAGRHWGYAQTMKDCSSKADIESKAVIDVGGLIGWIWNKSSISVEGGSFSGAITCAAGSNAGMLVGGSGNALEAVIGTVAKPVEVSGSLNGTALAAENAATLLWGDGFDETKHTINYVIK
jgi:hypothetical protein